MPTATTAPIDFDALWAQSHTSPVQAPSAPASIASVDLSLGTVLDRYVGILDPLVQTGKVDAAASAEIKQRIIDLKTALSKIDDKGLMAADMARRMAQLTAVQPDQKP